MTTTMPSTLERVQQRREEMIDADPASFSILQKDSSVMSLPRDPPTKEGSTDSKTNLSKFLALNRECSTRTLHTACSTLRDEDSNGETEEEEADVSGPLTPPPSPKQQRRPRPEQKQRSILILGATGRLGMECLRQFSHAVQDPRPALFAFCRDFKQLSQEAMDLCQKHCEQLIVGDATHSADLYRALQISQADTVLICVGGSASEGNKTTKKDATLVRTLSAVALIKVLVHPPFHHIRVLCVSNNGETAPSLSCALPSVRLLSGGATSSSSSSRTRDLQDHTGQEEALTGNKTIRDRTTIVRSTPFLRQESTSSGSTSMMLTSSSRSKSRLTTYSSDQKPPSFRTSRKDLAKWLVTETFYNIYQGRSVNVTSV